MYETHIKFTNVYRAKRRLLGTILLNVSNTDLLRISRDFNIKLSKHILSEAIQDALVYENFRIVLDKNIMIDGVSLDTIFRYIDYENSKSKKIGKIFKMIEDYYKLRG